MADNSVKFCALCGKDCANAPRIKDSRGTYYHDRCYMAAQRAQWRREQQITDASSAADVSPGEFDAAQEGNETMMAHLLAESERRVTMPVIPETKAAAEHGCPDCGTYVHPQARYCTKCGADLRTGEHLQTEVKFSKRKRRLLRRFDPMWRTFDQVVQQMAPGTVIVLGLLFISSLLAPDPMLMVLFAAVLSIVLVGHLSMAFLATRESIGTGIAVLLVPLYSLIYFIGSSSKARRSGVWTSVIGVVLLGGSFAFSAASERLFSDEREQLQQPTQMVDNDHAARDESGSPVDPDIVNDALATNGVEN